MSGGKKCVWRAVLQQCSCHTICPPVMGVLFSRPEQHAQTEAGAFFFFKPIHPPHQHINMQSMPAYASAARTSVAGCQTESEESAEMWEWHSKCENPLIRQSGDMWCDLCTIYVCRMKECEYTNVFAWKFLGKPRGKKKNSNNSRGMPLAVPCSISYNISVPF